MTPSLIRSTSNYEVIVFEILNFAPQLLWSRLGGI